jgi:ubiquinone biosynthesis protein
VTDRFGMETRTELILLQRTMVVVEGVARTLDPHINIWQVARPIVESYISDSIGPKAFLRDLAATARILGRFGPRLPQLAEAALIRSANPAVEPPEGRRWANAGLLAVGAAAGAALVWIGMLL